MAISIYPLGDILNVYNNNNDRFNFKGNKREKIPPKSRADEVTISIEGKKKQIMEEIMLGAIDGLSSKTFEK